MAESGESSGTKISKEVWAKLVPSDSRLSDVEINCNEILIHSEVMPSSLDKHGWCKITRNFDMLSATILNRSSSTIIVDGVNIKDDDDACIMSGSEIISGPDRTGYLSYRFVIMLPEETSQKHFKIPIDPEHLKCSICLNVWHDVVTAAPCLHNFCNGCFSEWLKRSQEKHSNVLCPQCRAVVQYVGRNHFLHNIEEEVLQCDASLRRSDEEFALLDSYATIKSYLVIGRGKKLHQKRARSLASEISISDDDSYIPEFSCLQCVGFWKAICICICGKRDLNHVHFSVHCSFHLNGYSALAEKTCALCTMFPQVVNFPLFSDFVYDLIVGIGYEGFRCNRNTVHLQCHACGGMMPSRTDVSVPQHCLGCDRSFCGAYWHAQRVTRSDYHPFCSQETFRPISERTISRIPFLAHEKNRHEQDITEKYIVHMGKTLQDVISEWLAKFNNREIDRTRMPLNHSEMITAGTYTCTDCYDKVVSFLLYWFRISLPKHLLPPDASNRIDCWYGYACRTQHHKEEHARTKNHVCRPTRGSNV